MNLTNRRTRSARINYRRMLLTAPGFAALALGLAVSLPAIAVAGPVSHQGQSIAFELVRSGAAANSGCLPNAGGRVRVENDGAVEVMHVDVHGLPPNTDFDVFIIQVPNPPFGLSWYQGDIETDALGNGSQKFMGRFSIETFIVAPGGTVAPVVHPVDASSNPATPPIHTYHVGIWFNSPADAARATCPGATTPFNGDHTAGVQILSTRNFPDDQGPLRQLAP